MAFSDEQVTTMRQKLGIAENADEATILAALDEALHERVEPPTATTGTPVVPEGMSLVDSEVLAELRSGAEAGRTARLELDNQARDTAIATAIRQGKTTTARRDHWVTSWAADPEGTKALLDSLEPGLAVPVNELGHGDEPDPAESIDAEVDAFAAAFNLQIGA